MRIPPIVPVFNWRDIWRELSATLFFRLENRATTIFSLHGAKHFCCLMALSGVASASRIRIHTFFYSYCLDFLRDSVTFTLTNEKHDTAFKVALRLDSREQLHFFTKHVLLTFCYLLFPKALPSKQHAMSSIIRSIKYFVATSLGAE